MQDIRKNDTVEVIAGDDRGKRGRVLTVFPGRGRVLVEGVSYIWRHVKPNQQNPQGGRVQKESPISLSNVMLVCPECKAPRRSRPSGRKRSKIRVCGKCGHQIASAAR